MKASTKISVTIRRFIRVLGPGLITGASDDDPSGIATYSQAGASFGLSTLWTALITFPLMASIQEMCARIGMVTSKGLTGVIKEHYPKRVNYLILLLSFPAIILNIGADIQGMGAVSNMLIPAIPSFAFSLAFSLLLVFIIIKFPFQRISNILKWLCLSLLLYLIVPFLVHVNWLSVLKHTVVPHIEFNKQFFGILVGILGTTISPYLFFWQASMEAEAMEQSTKKIVVDKRVVSHMQTDVNFGMLFSNLVMFFIILTTGTVLFSAGVKQIDTVDQAAKALEPLAGKMSYLLFAVGVIGTGFLAIPVLAGSLSYILAETFNWMHGLDKKFHQAKGFYITISVSVIMGLMLDFVHISPIQALIYTAILYGITAPFLIAIVLHICNNKAVMGEFTNSKLSNVLGFLTLLLMSAAAVALIYLQFA